VNLLTKLKDTMISVVPLMVIVLILHFFVFPLPKTILMDFLIGGILLILGLSVFLLGAEIGMVPIGQKVGSSLTRKRNLPLILVIGFVVGFALSVAEPDIQVLASQVTDADASITCTSLIMMISIGVGLFVSMAFARTIFQVPLKWLFSVFYGIVFILTAVVRPEFVGIAFDAGGATTGPMTVPFIMALGLGVASVRRNVSTSSVENDSFGFVGVASIGPILAVLLMGLISDGAAGTTSQAVSVEAFSTGTIIQHFLRLLPGISKEALKALLPLSFILLAFQVTLLHMPRHQVKKTILGLFYTFVGLVVFLVGTNGGFMPAGKALGAGIGNLGDGWALFPIGLLFGAVVVCAEPAVWVLTDQVEEVSGGHIRRPVMLITLAIGVGTAVALSMLRVVAGINLVWFLLAGYGIALIMTFFCPPLFTAIAFDSGGVATGPLSSTFILSFALGASAAFDGNPTTDAFGILAMIAMTPLIAIQTLGLIYKKKQHTMKKLKDRHKAQTASVRDKR
jgi:hypothetical protein